MSKPLNHTPGPWEMPTGPYTVPSTGEGDQFSGGDWHIFPPLGESGPVAIANSKDNALLIAAAPDLLAACVMAFDLTNTSHMLTERAWDDACQRTFEACRDALKKVKGAET